MEELQMIQEFLEEPLTDDIELVEARGSMLQVYLARSGKIFADSKAEYNKAITSEVMEILKKAAMGAGASHTAVNTLVKAACSNEQYLVDWSERIHKTTARQLDWCRSVLSKYKAELTMNTYGGGGN